ncbi:MAG: LegC family aminotransferase [Dissulfurispiraceae bacterium]
MSDSNTRNVIPLSEPEISGNEWKYIKDCLDTGWVSSAGEYVNRFEKMVADYVDSKYAVATVNGTSALHISLLLCGVEPGDEVIVPALTFVAPVNTVRYCGAHPVFMDCDRSTLCMDFGKMNDFLSYECEQRKNGHTYNKKTGRRIRAVIPVHVFGHPADMDQISAICAANNIEIIEDATESLGSKYKGKQTGTFGKIGCLSFNGNKIITTGGGGMVITDDNTIAERARHLTTQARSDSFEYDHDEIGYNYRLSSVQAAIGVAQMERLDHFVTAKRKKALLYREMLSNIEQVEFLWEKEQVRSNFWFYTIRVPKGHKRALMEHLISNNIQVRPIWKLIHTLPMYNDCQSYRIEKALEAYDKSINIPCSVNLTTGDIETVAENIKSYFLMS